MNNRESKNVFEADAKSLYKLYTIEGSLAGFRIPIFQRNYDWDKSNIQRLYEDILSGLCGRINDPESLTFIGTIIVVEEDTKNELTFDGRSLSVIDGQQRLTTLSLMASVLHEAISKSAEKINNLPSNISSWIEDESRYIKTRLLNLVFGQLSDDGTTMFPFPRIVREEEDFRGINRKEAEYSSIIAKYLNEFSKNIIKEKTEYFSYKPDNNPWTKAFKNNLEYISQWINIIETGEENTSNDIEIRIPALKYFPKRGIKKLFNKLPIDDSEKNRVLSSVEKYSEEIQQCLQLLLFSAYLLNAVLVILVKARDEKYAFDIFDALNTTGEPLTAFQTFKPQVIKFEKNNDGYKGSISEKLINSIEQYFDKYNTSDSRQKEAKDIIVPFALYLTGEKRSRNLNDQRRYLRNNFDNINGNEYIDLRRKFVARLAEICDYKNRFWDDNLECQLPGFPDRELVLLCLKFLSSLNNSLTIPILTRYYTYSINKNNKAIFSNAVKALTAFIVLRRGATGGTAGIDSDLRGIMSTGKKSKDSLSTPLCCGLDNSNIILDICTFKKYLRDWLNGQKVNVSNKDSWIIKASTKPLYEHSKPLCRFIIIAACNNARPDPSNPWLLKKVKPSNEINYLNYTRFNSGELSTVEHIAPQSPSKGWKNDIYSLPHFIHCLGNLTLLPEKENIALNNSSWKIKKKIYQAFSSETLCEIEKIIKDAKMDGITLGEKTKKLLNKGTQLPITKTISKSPEWSKSIIEKRSKNIAELAWDEISNWLFDN